MAGGDSERVYKNDHVYADELIETVKKSSAQIRFLHDTGLWLAASSQLTLDSFFYDPESGTGEMLAELGTGLFRFVTPETRVVMADGGLKAIADIVVGERVLGRHGTLNVVTGVERVTLGSRMLYGFDGGPRLVTAEHPFMTDEGWKSIDPWATAAENGSLYVAKLEPGDALLTMRRSAWRLAALGDPRGLSEGALGHQRLSSVSAVAGDSGTVLYNLLLDGNHTYWVVQSAAASIMQTISVAADPPGGTGKAYLVHNKGG